MKMIHSKAVKAAHFFYESRPEFVCGFFFRFYHQCVADNNLDFKLILIYHLVVEINRSFSARDVLTYPFWHTIGRLNDSSDPLTVPQNDSDSFINEKQKLILHLHFTEGIQNVCCEEKRLIFHSFSTA